MRSGLNLDVAHSPEAEVPRQPYRSVWIVFGIYFTVGVGLMLTRFTPPFGPLSDFLFIFFAALVVFLTEVRIIGWGKALCAFGWVAIVSGLVESIGTLSGFPFGNYTYTEAFGPRLFGLLPLAIPLAWWLVLMPVYRLLGLLRQRSALVFVALVAIGVTAVDFVIEPVAVVIKGYWIWQDGGFYYGVPWTNFVGWILTAAVLTIGLNRILPKSDPFARPTTRQHAWLLILVLSFFMVVLLRDGIYPPVALGLLLMAGAYWRK
jgi:putative membrane protein